MKKFIILASIAFTMSASAATETFTGNQGDKPQEFSSQIFAGQWVIDDYKEASTGLRERPAFTNIEQGDIVNLDQKIKTYKASGDRSELLFAVKMKDEITEALNVAHRIDYVNKNFTSENIKKASRNSVRRKIQKEQKGFFNDNDENTISLSHFSDKHIVSTLDAFVLMNYRNVETLEKKHNEWAAQIEKLEKSKSFNLSESVDFFMIDSGASLYAIDIVSKDEFILYSIRRGNSVTYLRTDETITPITTASLFQKIEGK